MLLVGLGNPGRRYAKNRHNIGFMALDEIASRYGFGPWRKRFQGEIAAGDVNGVRVLALKPMTGMNGSGQSVGEAARFFKLDPEDVVVLHDELDLAAGKLRIKQGGGHAGHNGLRSIDSHLGKNYRRIRLGIGHPGAKHKVSKHVLSDFGAADRDWVDPFLDAIADAAPLLAKDDDAGFASRVASILNPPTQKGSRAEAAKPGQQSG